MHHFALSVIGRDRPGIVAAMAGALLEHGANIEDSHCAILRGHFSMTLVLAMEGEVDEAALRRDLEDTGAELGLEAVSLSPIADAGAEAVEPTHIVTVYGADHPGIVHALASALGAAEVNITDLNTRLVEASDGDDLYAMMLEVALPAGLHPDDLEGLLEVPRSEQGVEVTVRELEQDAL